LPAHDGTDAKRLRGTVVVIGGSRETPGAVLLAGGAALRVGAGRLRLATVDSTAAALAVAIPEARVTGLSETEDGAISPATAPHLASIVATADALLVGTGALDDSATAALLEALVPEIGTETNVVLDAGALPALHDRPALVAPIADRTVLIPNPSEMARMLGWEEVDVREDAARALGEAVVRFGCVVALRDAVTWISAPGEPCYVDRSGHLALGTSGSGDVLAGALAGLAARGTDLLRATLWATHLHGVTGERLARKGPALGLLAHEVMDELPITMRALA
jgi:hydroxyethylthiazole kinase-like uncharacterized protein yjeF